MLACKHNVKIPIPCKNTLSIIYIVNIDPIKMTLCLTGTGFDNPRILEMQQTFMACISMIDSKWKQ